MALPAITGEFRVGADPELRFAPSGLAVCNIRAVASSRKKNDAGEWVDDKTSWVTLTLFKEAAENAAESFAKGDLVVVTGRLEVQEWEKDGHKNRAAAVLVDSMGHSIRWDASRVVKMERQQGGGGGQRQQSSSSDGDPWAAPPAQDDEPPF